MSELDSTGLSSSGDESTASDESREYFQLVCGCSSNIWCAAVIKKFFNFSYIERYRQIWPALYRNPVFAALIIVIRPSLEAFYVGEMGVDLIALLVFHSQLENDGISWCAFQHCPESQNTHTHETRHNDRRKINVFIGFNDRQKDRLGLIWICTLKKIRFFS